MRRYDICAAVVGHLPYDARVWKEVSSLAEAGYSVKLIGNRYDLNATLRYSVGKIDVIEVPFGPRSGDVSNVTRARSVLKLWLEVLRANARVYHAHNVHTVPPMLLSSLLRKARFVYDGHELYGEPGSSSIKDRAIARAMRLVEKLAVRRADAVITTNQSRVDVLCRRHGRPGIVCLPNVPNLVETVVPIDPGFPAEVPILLYQGGIYAEARAFRETITALESLPEVHFVIVGFGRDRDLRMIESWAAESDVSERVHLLGPRPFEELVHTAASATVGLVPLKPISLNSYLGDTNKLHEYLMAGVPVVASSFPEVESVARQGEPAVGEVFDPEDPESIAKAIRKVIDDPDYEDRRIEARRQALEHHNWGVAEVALVALYAELIGAGSRESEGDR